MMITQYKILPWSGEDRRYRVYDTLDDALEAASDLRNHNRGYFLYEATGKSLRLIKGWEAPCA